MVPSARSPSLITKLREDNESLKLQLAALQRKFEVAERMRIEQDEQLRERIEIARREVRCLIMEVASSLVSLSFGI
jgi:hypothetical protein